MQDDRILGVCSSSTGKQVSYHSISHLDRVRKWGFYIKEIGQACASEFDPSQKSLQSSYVRVQHS